MEHIFSLFYKLKTINRANRVHTDKDPRFETDAEHCYTMLALANCFLKKEDGLDGLKVFRMIIYHDLIEALVGDCDVFNGEESRAKQKQKEKQALEKSITLVPEELGAEYRQIIEEYEEQKTREAKFVKAIDYLDPMVQALEHKNDWHKYKLTEEKYRKLKEPYFKEFPSILNFFNETMKHCRENGYFVD